MEGNLRFKIDCAALALQMEGNLPFFLCFTLYLRAISKYKPPRGLYLEGLIFGILRYFPHLAFSDAACGLLNPYQFLNLL